MRAAEIEDGGETLRELSTGSAAIRHKAIGRKPVSTRKIPDPNNDRVWMSCEGFCLSESSTIRLKLRKGWRLGEVAGMTVRFHRVRPQGQDRDWWASENTGALYHTKTLRNQGGQLKIKWCR